MACMKVCVIGGGAIGGLITARLETLANTTQGTETLQVSLLARGATLAAVQRDGLRVIGPGATLHVHPRVSDQPKDFSTQDLLIVAVKAPALAALVPTLGPLLSPSTIVLPAMNGVPWWFCQGIVGFEEPLLSVDPAGVIAGGLPVARVLGCVVHASASVDQPGVVSHKMGHGLIVGEPAGGPSERARRVVGLLAQAGFDASLADDIRRDIWYKLWGNLTTNPASAITGATVDKLLGDPLVREFMSRAMHEACAVGARVGCVIDQSPEDRHRITSKLGAFKTSMLQDAEAGRPIELDAIVTVVHEMAQRLGMVTPSIDALLGLTRVFARERGLYAESPY